MEIYDLSYDPRDPLYDLPDMPGVRWGVQVFTTRNLYQLDPAQVSLTDGGMTLAAGGLSWAGQQQRSPGEVIVHISRDGDAYLWRIQARHAEPIKAVKLMLWGLPISAFEQGWWQPTSTAARTAIPTLTTPVRWNYPWREWLTPWACAGEQDGSPLICVSFRDREVRAKRLYTHLPPYADGQPVLELIFEEDARRWDGSIATCEMRLRVTDRLADVDADFAAHLAFVQDAYGLQPWETRPDVPDWMRDIRLVLNLHGQHWTGYVFNTFDQMAQTLRTLTQHVPGRNILAYLPGFEGRYYYAYPHYRPGEALGGDAAFRRLVAEADRLEVKLMPMFGMHGANVQVYPDYERSAFRSRTNSYLTLVNFPDWDTDRFGEDDQVFLNPGEPTFRQHLMEQVSGIVRDYGVSGVFLDTSACWFNDPRHNLYEGYQKLIAALHERHPGLLVAGEGWFDALLAVLPVNQSWLGVDRHFKYPQILARYGRALGHLAEGAPGPVSTGVHERGFTYRVAGPVTPGHIASVGIADDTMTRYVDEVIAACRAAVG
ncbi:MAG: hypothetical protein L6Q98_13995 [Anaerolineae bacterium]|nr:hypothetical protein [Anaerolineae bacterium]NUQ03332.1 hypothetical protein [Anaerolineae bacterium]